MFSARVRGVALVAVMVAAPSLLVCQAAVTPLGQPGSAVRAVGPAGVVPVRAPATGDRASAAGAPGAPASASATSSTAVSSTSDGSVAPAARGASAGQPPSASAARSSVPSSPTATTATTATTASAEPVPAGEPAVESREQAVPAHNQAQPAREREWQPSSGVDAASVGNAVPAGLLYDYQPSGCSLAPIQKQMSFERVGSGASSVAAVARPDLGGDCATRFTLAPGDTRIEFAGYQRVVSGTTRYYNVRVFLGADFPVAAAGTNTVFAQFLNADGAGDYAPPVQMTIQDGEFHLWNYSTPTGKMDDSHATIRYNLLWRAPVRAGVWLDFTFGITWSANATGALTLWYDGVQVAQATGLQTLYRDAMGQPAKMYPKFGLYGSAMSQTRTADFAWFRIGQSYASVAS